MKCGIVVFPGSNCERDCGHVLGRVLGQKVQYIWHKEAKLPKLDLVVLPGGFSYGDYLRAGAIARFSPVMEAVVAFANGGGKVLGICNGFQILVEAKLLPGILLQNAGRKFICENVALEVTNAQTIFTKAYSKGQTIHLPVAHMDGRYYADEEALKRIKGEGQIVFRYRNNPNGALADIAGLCNVEGNVLGMMPHPERCAEALLGNTDGLGVFQSLL